MNADRYLFDGSHPCALRKLPCDSKDDHVKKEDILPKLPKTWKRWPPCRTPFTPMGARAL